MKLYHISENDNIKIFKAREIKRSWDNLKDKYVWAISSEMVHNYFFPRDCPRVCWMIGPQTSKEDKDYFNSFNSKGVIFAEKKWKKAIETTTMYKYEFNSSNFYPVDYGAGYYVSEQDEIPISKVAITNLIKELEKRKVKLIFVDDLTPYQMDSVKRNYRFSNIRMNNKNKNSLNL